MQIKNNNIMNVMILGRSDDVYTIEYTKEIARAGVHAFVLDIRNGTYTDGDKSTSLRHFPSWCYINIISRLILSIIDAYMHFIKNTLKYDAIHILYNRYEYILLINAIHRCTNKIIVTIYGDDFILSKTKGIQKIIYDFADCITFNNAFRKDYFNAYYKKVYDNKIKMAYFGYAINTLIEVLRESYSRIEIKHKLNIPDCNTVVTVGTNGITAQNHIAIIESLSSMVQGYKDFTFILPLTYGCTNRYKSQIVASAKKYLDGCQIIVYDTFMSDEEVAFLRLATDIQIQLQLRDSLSGAMLQALCAGAYVITGDWLEYPDLNERDVYYSRIKKIDDIKTVVKQYLAHSIEIKEKCNNNIGKLREIAFWNEVIPVWKNLYKVSDDVSFFNCSLNL